MLFFTNNFYRAFLLCEKILRTFTHLVAYSLKSHLCGNLDLYVFVTIC